MTSSPLPGRRRVIITQSILPHLQEEQGKQAHATLKVFPLKHWEEFLDCEGETCGPQGTVGSCLEIFKCRMTTICLGRLR